MSIDLDAVEAAAKAATPGPWSAMRWSGDTWPDARISVGADEHGSRMAIAMNTRYAKRPEEDMAHIATMDPTTTLALVEEVRRLRATRTVHWRDTEDAQPHPEVYCYVVNLFGVHEAWLGHDDVWRLRGKDDVELSGVTHWVPVCELPMPARSVIERDRLLKRPSE
jgi:hypothetical protein